MYAAGERKQLRHFVVSFYFIITTNNDERTYLLHKYLSWVSIIIIFQSLSHIVCGRHVLIFSLTLSCHPLYNPSIISFLCSHSCALIPNTFHSHYSSLFPSLALITNCDVATHSSFCPSLSLHTSISTFASPLHVLFHPSLW